MKKIIVRAVATVGILTCEALASEWEDLSVNSLNRMPARTYTIPLADEDAAFTDALEPETPFKMSLNGLWKFAWAGSPELRVKGRPRVKYVLRQGGK